jgi:hypothetical protein
MRNTIFIGCITLICILTLIASYAVASPKDEVKKQFSLEECIALATENYPAIKRYDLVNLTGELTIRNINKSYLPMPSLLLKGSYQSDVTSLPLLAPGMKVDPMSKDQYSAALNIEQVIWDGGVTSALKREANTRADYDRSEIEVEIYSLKERVQNLYFGILLADSFLNEIVLADKEIERIKEKIEAFIESGVANSSDLDEVLVRKITVSQRRKEILSDRKSYISMLSVMTGVPIDESVVLVTPQSKSFEINAQNRRPELKLFNIGQEMTIVAKNHINIRNRPKFGAFVQLGYGRPGLNMLKDEFAGFYIAGVRMTWSIGSLYTSKNDKRLQDIRFNNIESQKETFLYNTRVRGVGSSQKILKIEELLSGDEEVVTLRSRLAESALEKLEAGSISLSDYIKELIQLDSARCIRSRRKIELLLAIYEMNYLLNN